ncbi:MAG: CapA family protein [Niameybacter sp.]
MNKRKIIIIMALLGLVGMGSCQVRAIEVGQVIRFSQALIEQKQQLELQKALIEEKKQELQEAAELAREQSLTISFAGDCTLGTYYGQGEWNRFDRVANEKGYAHFFNNVRPYFAVDDLTVVNLEGPLTTGGTRADKTFAIKGDPSYTKILKEGSIEAVSLANNHTYDYGSEGMKQTKQALQAANIDYFIEDTISYREVKGIKIALIGEKGWDKSQGTKEKLKKHIKAAKAQADLVFVMFHWGIEREHYPNDIQKELARLCIDEGADLVIGSHPHVIQGIETYKGKNIIYSLGNFSFGANKNPDDKDTFIYQATYTIKDGQVTFSKSEVIPCSISSTKDRNTYQPTPLEGTEKERVQNRLKIYSSKFEIPYFN